MISKKVGWCELVRWMAPSGGAKAADGLYHDCSWWETYFDDRFKQLEEKLAPEGFVMLENKMLDSHKLGRRYVLPFGGRASLHRIPDRPFSIDGTASGTVSVEGAYFTEA